MAKVFRIAGNRDWRDSPVMQKLMDRDRRRSEKVLARQKKGAKYGNDNKNSIQDTGS